MIEQGPEQHFGFTDEEVARFTALVVARGYEVDSDVGLHLLNSLADVGTKIVLGLPDGDVVITTQEAEAAIGRPLGPMR